MAYVLAGTTIKAPKTMDVANSTQYAQQRALSGAIGRDYFGSNKQQWKLTYENIQKADYDTIKTIYDSYLATETTKTFAVTETNYTVASTNVHMDLVMREFRVGGSSFISDFDLVLTEE